MARDGLRVATYICARLIALPLALGAGVYAAELMPARPSGDTANTWSVEVKVICAIVAP